MKNNISMRVASYFMLKLFNSHGVILGILSLLRGGNSANLT